MEKSVRRDSLMTTIALLFLVTILGCGDLEAPYGSDIAMPDDTSIVTDSNVVFDIGAVVVDSNLNPMNEIDVEFLLFCGYISGTTQAGCDFIDQEGGILPSGITIATDEWGVAKIKVLIYADFEGEVIVSASSGAHRGAQTIITKTIPAEE